MSWKKEPCRNFQRGNCRYGDHCKFLHVNQSQSKPNPFGFGSGSVSQSLNTSQQKQQLNTFGFSPVSTPQQQKQQQQSNPFGFGVQNSHQVKSASPFGHQSSYQKPFENKWIRSVNSPSPEQTDSQPRTVSHKCEDANVCKQLIVEDLTNERPLWILTCYGHFKGLPCDIFGDTSYEELRAAAYDDAKKGLSLQSIVERERNLLNSKLLEFDKLLRNPYVISHENGSPLSVPVGVSFQAFSFGQSGHSAVFPSMSGQTSPFQNLSQIANGIDTGYRTSDLLGGQLPKQPLGTFGSNISNATQSGMFSAFSNSTISEYSIMHGVSGTAGDSFSLTTAGSLENRGEPIDAGIWIKEKWSVKEIPEEEPPARFCLD